MRNLEASDLLDEDQLSELADALLWEDRVAFAIPAQWIASPLPTGRRCRASGRPLVEPGTAAARQTLPYLCRPPAAARRWAATWLLSHDAAQVEAILAWAGRLDAGAGGAVAPNSSNRRCGARWRGRPHRCGDERSTCWLPPDVWIRPATSRLRTAPRTFDAGDHPSIGSRSPRSRPSSNSGSEGAASPNRVRHSV